MAKKKATTRKSDESPKKRIQKMKGGFGVFLRHDMDKHPVSDDDIPITAFLEQIASDLKDTQDALRWVREKAEAYQGRTLVIAQVKQEITVAVEKIVKVKIVEV